MHSPLPDQLSAILTDEFAHAPHIISLFETFLCASTYHQPLVTELIEVASGRSGEAWGVRQLATLMLEHQVLKLSHDDEAYPTLLTRLGLRDDEIRGSALQEGYTTTETKDFIRELRQKLARLNRIHEPLQGVATTAEQLRDFLYMARRPCKLALARYLFTPKEVVDQILDQVKLSRGQQDRFEPQHPYAAEEAEYAQSWLPAYEASILRTLCDRAQIYWVGDQTPSETNALVQYPPNTVVLVVKPPGSHIEFELKRAGLRGASPISIVYEREGQAVPPSHRLDGGSMNWSLRWEAGAAAILSKIYRLVHGHQAPISRTISRASVHAVPVDDGEVHTLDYFTMPHHFGSGFGDMRDAMEKSIDAFRKEREWGLPELPGDFGLTVHFINNVAPAQAILSGTSAFRIDWLAKRLTQPDGVDPDHGDPRRFVDELLDEILGVYASPDTPYCEPKSCVDAAFARPDNRHRANQVYLSLMQQMGQFWGTLLGVRGYSNGESCIARNVGLKSVWNNGEWQVRVIFMDHDGLCIAGKAEKQFHPVDALSGMLYDELHLLGTRSCRPDAIGNADYLEAIYRIGPEVSHAGLTQFDRATLHAYRKTQEAMGACAELKGLFRNHFVERLGDWDHIVRQYFASQRDGVELADWERDARRYLSGQGYKSYLINEYVEAVKNHEFFLARQVYAQLS